MFRKNKGFASFFMSIFVLSCISWSSVSYAKDGWAADELLLQLQELRRQINGLKSRVSFLEKENSEIRLTLASKKIGDLSINLNGSVRVGSPAARLAIVEFSDYQCPFCKKHYQTTFSKLRSNYIETGKLQYAIYDFPLSFHAQGVPAAIAASCAGNQGKYMQMHEKLFTAKVPLGQALYAESADSLGLDREKFNQCMTSPAQQERIAAHIQYGVKLGVQGTPAFFIGQVSGDQIENVKVIKGAQSYAYFSRILDGMLK